MIHYVIIIVEMFNTHYVALLSKYDMINLPCQISLNLVLFSIRYEELHGQWVNYQVFKDREESAYLPSFKTL